MSKKIKIVLIVSALALVSMISAHAASDVHSSSEAVVLCPYYSCSIPAATLAYQGRSCSIQNCYELVFSWKCGVYSIAEHGTDILCIGGHYN